MAAGETHLWPPSAADCNYSIFSLFNLLVNLVEFSVLIKVTVDELAKDERIAKLYAAWGDWQNEILQTYYNPFSPQLLLSQQKQVKSIKNMVTAEALKLGGHHVHLRINSFGNPLALLCVRHYCNCEFWMQQR